MTSIDFLKLVINVSLYTEMSQFFPMITLLYRSCRVLSRCLLLDISRLWPICKYRLFSLFPLRYVPIHDWVLRLHSRKESHKTVILDVRVSKSIQEVASPIGNPKVGVFIFAWAPITQYSQPCQFSLILPKSRKSQSLTKEMHAKCSISCPLIRSAG